jgi:1-acyl-sn-glycerol-3-phosphate acyltransferase
MSSILDASPTLVRRPAGWSRAPVAMWRLLRVLVHLLVALVKTYTVWRDASPALQHAVKLRWSGQLLRILGIELKVSGLAPRPGAKLVVANHISWLDIVALNAVVPSRFVSKAEVADWPIVGRIGTMAGTLYLVRERRRDAMRVLGLMAQALREGGTVAVFPEGTTGSGHGLLHFHGNLLQAAIDAEVPIQPVALRYSDPQQAVSDVAAYVGDISLMQSLWQVVAARGLQIHVTVLPAQAVNHADRRALAEQLQALVAASLDGQMADDGRHHVKN